MVGRDSVEPTLERSEANEVSIFPFPNGDRDARFARASCVGRVGSTESLPTHLRRFMERDDELDAAQPRQRERSTARLLTYDREVPPGSSCWFRREGSAAAG